MNFFLLKNEMNNKILESSDVQMNNNEKSLKKINENSIFYKLKNFFTRFFNFIGKEKKENLESAESIESVSNIRENSKNTFLESIKNIENEIPLERIGSTMDIAKCVEWLVEDNYTTGQIISINGGWIIV